MRYLSRQKLGLGGDSLGWDGGVTVGMKTCFLSSNFGLNLIKYDNRSTTGHNIRRILLLIRKSSIEEVTSEDVDTIEYHNIEDRDKWRVEILKEILETRNNQLQIDGFSPEDCEKILIDICTS